MRRLAALLLTIAFPALAADRDTLRADYAKHFFDARAHLRLAKFIADAGDLQTGFYISEAARRSYFEEEEFRRAVQEVFLDDHFDNSAEAEARLQADVDAAPADPQKHERLGDVYLSRGEWKKAEVELRKAVELEPESFARVDVLAEVLARDGRETDAQALRSAWLAKHPQSVDALRVRIETLIDAESPDARKAIEEALKTYPGDAMLHFRLAYVLQKSQDLKGAAREFEKAAELDPKSPFMQGWTGRFFLKAADDPEKALRYYLAAYFLDPDFYDTEYAEGRIRKLTWERGAARAATLQEKGATVESLLRDVDPVVVGMALEIADQQWRAELAAPVIALLHHDDPNLRSGAATILGHHLKADDERIAEMLASSDLLVRGSAAYIAGELQKEKIVPVMVQWLSDPAELMQNDAVSVLATYGGAAGREALMKLRESGKEVHPRIRMMLDAVANGAEEGEAEPEP